MTQNIFIKSAKYIADLTVRLLFNDGTERDVNFGNYMRQHPHPQYEKYLDEKKFKSFRIENGNIVWGKNWDMIFPIDQLHSGVIL